MPVYRDKTTGKWFYEFSYKTATGVRKKRKKRGFELKSEAKKAEALEKIKCKEAPPSAMTFSQLCQLYIEAKKPEWLPGTERKFTTDARLHILPFFGDMQIDKISSKDIEDWKLVMYQNKTSVGKPYAPKTLNRIKGNLNALFHYAVNHRFITFNPASGVGGFKNPAKTEQPEKQVWTPKEFRRFLACVDDENWRVFFMFLWSTGLRIGEAQGVMFQDVDLKKETVTINKSIDTKQKGIEYAINPTKTKKPRTIELPEELMAVLVPYYKTRTRLDDFSPDRFLFGYTKPLPNSTIDKYRNKYIAQAGVKYISSHCFRHSHATYLLANGVDVKSVSERLGHKDVEETLNTYAHVLPSSKDKILHLLNQSLAADKKS